MSWILFTADLRDFRLFFFGFSVALQITRYQWVSCCYPQCRLRDFFRFLPPFGKLRMALELGEID
jgi:hypothetical protein